MKAATRPIPKVKAATETPVAAYIPRYAPVEKPKALDERVSASSRKC
jgi:hypothetical protein